MINPAHPPVAHRPIYRWLLVVYLSILAMVVIGGITRLTESGLSMVEWRPLIGALPPLNEADWLAVFAEYQKTPQYQQVNHWMGLADFKRIFFWEYVHRLAGRLIGVIFIVPWIWFVARGRLRGGLAVKTFVAFVLGGLQGALGWFMVMSGLRDVPAVSHYRLAAHLSLAFLVGLYVLWIALDLRFTRTGPDHPGVRRAAWALMALTGVQVVFGAFMAGLRAGWLYPDFPTMGGQWLPEGALYMEPVWQNLLVNPIGVHFTHRTLGWLVLGAGLVFTAYALPRARTRAQQVAAVLPGAMVTLQFLLGALTVILMVPISIATAHQLGALLLLSTVLYAIHAFGHRPPGAPLAGS